MAFRYTPTPTPSVTPTLSLTASLTPSNTATGTVCPGLTPTETNIPVTPTPTGTPTNTPTPNVTSSPTNTPTPSQTPSPPACLCYFILNETGSPGDYTYIECASGLPITNPLAGGASVRVCSSDLPIVDVGLTVAPCIDITTCTQDSDCTGCSF